MKNESHLQTFLIHFYWQRVENVFGRIDDSINGKKALFVLLVTWKGFFSFLELKLYTLPVGKSCLKSLPI